MKRVAGVLLVACAFFAFGGRALAQTSRDGKLIVTVVDPQQGVLPDATVTLTGLDDVTKGKTIAPTKANDKGIATFEGVTPGRYTIHGEFPGLEVGWLRDIRVRTGENKHVLVLPLRTLTDAITVGRDRQEAAADRATSFGTALTREQIDLLSDDPDEMKRQLEEMAGPGAKIRVDSFEGADLPPKSQIKSIHITRDQFAAETHGAGGIFIDIITQPGLGPIRTSVRGGFTSSAFDGVNPIVNKRGPAENRSFGGTFGGPLVKDKSQFSVSMNGFNNYSTPILNVATRDGVRAEVLGVRTPTVNVSFNGLLDYAVTKDQTLRFGMSRGSSHTDNLGLGSFDLPERAYSTRNDSWTFRAQEAGPLGRRFFTNTRFNISSINSSATSFVEAPTVQVLDQFTSGGAQQKGATHGKNFTFASDLDYVRGKNSWRAGVQVDGTRYRTDSMRNYFGTYVFESREAFDASRPRSFTIRIGDPRVEYWNFQTGFYLQDDLRLRKNLTISAGVRFEAQTHLSDYNNIGPRAGITWSPFKSGRTSVRASWGIFYDWLATGTYQQVLQTDGVHQQEINVPNPTFPAPGIAGTAPPGNKYLLGANLRMPRNDRVSLGVSQTLGRRFSVYETYYDTRGTSQFVGRNLNAPVNGVRPDPAFANIFEVTSEGKTRTKSLSTSVSLSLAPLQPASSASAPIMMPGSVGPLFQWRRGLYVYSDYTISKSDTNTDGPFAVPATGNLADEWGPSSFDTRHRASIGISTSAFRNFNGSFSINANSAPPLTIRTGYDDNGDLIYNDRPAGVGRNTVRTIGRYSVDGFFSYGISFGKKLVGGGAGGPVGIMITSSGAATAMTMPSQPRYRLNIGVNLQNLTNHATYSGYSGVMTSPFFLKPTTASGVRRLSFNLGLSF
jgi:Carboxypeptidase regulatory-like domain